MMPTRNLDVGRHLEEIAVEQCSVEFSDDLEFGVEVEEIRRTAFHLQRPDIYN